MLYFVELVLFLLTDEIVVSCHDLKAAFSFLCLTENSYLRDFMKNHSYKDMIKSSGRTSRQALTVLRNLQLPNIPPCYHVAYELCEGTDSKLQQQFSELSGDPTDILNDVQSIYYDLVALPQERELIQFSQRFHQLAQSMATSVKGGGNQLRDYANYLKDIKPFLKIGSDDEILDVTTLLIKETEAVHRYATELEDELKNASKHIDKLQEQYTRCREQSNRDHLTGTLNRSGLESAYEEIKMQEEFFPLSVLLVDIDRFKLFNDEYGHLVGDSVLKVIGSTLRKNIKGVDIISRFGGEEFIILLLNTGSTGASIVAEKLRKLVEDLRIKRRNSNEYLKTSTISIGISQLGTGGVLLDAIDEADKALYKAKDLGRNQVISQEDEIS